MNMETKESHGLITHEQGGLIEDYLRYLGEKKNRSALTLESYRNDLGQFAAFLTDSADADAALLAANADSACRFVDGLKSQYTRSTLNRKITAVRGFYGYLVAAAKVTANPLDPLHTQSARTASFDFLEEARLQQLFDTISGGHWLAFRDRAIVAMLYSTGMRVGELLNCRLDDLDADCETVQIRAAGRPTRLGHLVTWAAQAVKQYIARRPSKDIAEKILFVNRDGNPLTARSIRRKLSDYSRQANLPVEATPAVLRHSCAIHLLRGGADPKTVRDLLGHLSASSIRPYLNYLAARADQPAAEPVAVAAL